MLAVLVQHMCSRIFAIMRVEEIVETVGEGVRAILVEVAIAVQRECHRRVAGSY